MFDLDAFADDEVTLAPDERANELTMREGSERLLEALCKAKGLPQPGNEKPRRQLAAQAWIPPRNPTLWPRWYEPPKLGRLTGKELARSIAHDFGITTAEMLSADRHPEMVDARAVMARILRERGMSYPQIARAIGRGDHSTVMNLTDKFSIYARRNPTVERSYEKHRARDAAA